MVDEIISHVKQKSQVKIYEFFVEEKNPKIILKIVLDNSAIWIYYYLVRKKERKRKENKMFGYVFVYGVDGFGNDTAFDAREGVYLNFDKAFARQCELNADCTSFYEEGYGEDYYPETNHILAEAEENEDWDTYDKELAKHILTDIKEICEQINSFDEPPFGCYQLVEVEIYE